MTLNDGFSANSLEVYGGRFSKMGVRLGAPSWVWPGGYAENSRKLKPTFDEIQLTAYEPHGSDSIGADETGELRALKSETFGYSLHLPIPTRLAEREANEPESAIVDTIVAFRDVGVRNYVLHIERSSRGFDVSLAAERLARIIEKTGLSAQSICVENVIGTPFDKVWEAVKTLGVSICFDTGHWTVEGGRPVEFLEKYGQKIRMAHIHGVVELRDHLPLTYIPEKTLREIVSGLAEIPIAGAVIIENFSVEYMAQSLECLAKIYGNAG